MRIILAIAAKEFLHILRDPRSLTVALLMPLMMVLLYGYAIDMELRHLPVAVLDLDQSTSSRALIRDITSSDFIREAGRLSSREEIEPGFHRQQFLAALVIPRGHARALAHGEDAPVQLVVDGADAATASAVYNYLQQALQLHNLGRLESQGLRPAASMQPAPVFRFNPQRVSAWFIVPGLAAIVLIMICALLTSIAIVREKETGTLEQVLTTPMTPLQLILGKLQPYLLIGILDTVMIFAVGRFVFQVPMVGSWWALAGYTLLYLWVSLAIGLLISALTKTQQVAMLVALMVTLLPTLMLSGFIFSVSSMPLPLQVVSHAIPATWYLRIVRGVMLTGVNGWPREALVLLGMALGLTVLAMKRFSRRLA
ncbi:MAG: ABC transporter permease [Candidatus Cloacimonetes bacterium]|nr:ABC transporter permease [Candidatus Cloacimonadota bacterium]